MKRLVAVAVAALAAAGCGEDAAQVRLVPRFGTCARPLGARALLVTPLGDFLAERRPVDLGAAVTLADLPATTEQLAVEVVGADGAIAAVGKTARFELAALTDGAELAIAMAPLDGFCRLDGRMTVARTRPLVARTGDRVLIAGGYGPTGLPLASAELFDPATDSFREVALPSGLLEPRGLAGAALVPLPDDRIALVSGPRSGFAIYAPGDDFGGSGVLVNQVRSHAAAVALDATRVLLAGGCSRVADDGRCQEIRADSMILDVISGDIVPGPPLAVARQDGQAFLEVGLDGARRVVLIGGVDAEGVAVTTGERLALDGGPGVGFAVTGGVGAALDAGSLVTAFAADGQAPAGVAAAIVPGVDAAVPLTATAVRTGVALVTQEDGHVLALGGGAPLRYRPASATWRAVPTGPNDPAAPALPGGHAAIRLDDGSVLIVGGSDGGADDRAWRFRPPLLGPLAGSLTVVPADEASAPALTPLDPGGVTQTPAWSLREPASGGASWAVIGGVVGRDLRVELTASSANAGVAVLLGFVDAAHHHRAVIVPGQPAHLDRHADGAVATLCGGDQVPAMDDPATVTVEVRGSTVRVAAGGRLVLTCDAGDLGPGRIGVAALGGAVAIETIAVNR